MKTWHKFWPNQLLINFYSIFRGKAYAFPLFALIVILLTVITISKSIAQEKPTEQTATADVEEPEEKEEPEEAEEPEEKEEPEETEEPEEKEEPEEAETDEDAEDDEETSEEKPAEVKVEKKASFPGLIDTFTELINIDKKKYQSKFDKLKNNGKISAKFDINSQFDLDPDYLNTLLFYTPTKYGQLAFGHFCTFFDLMLNDLVYTYNQSNYVMLRSAKESEELAINLIPHEAYLSRALLMGCRKSAVLRNYFSVTKIKTTMQKIEFKQPKDYDFCLKEHSQHLKDPKTPYFCRALNDIRDGEKAQRQLPNAERDSLPIVGKIRQRIAYGKQIRSAFNDAQYQYIQNLCDHLESPKKYCDSVFNKNFWKKIAEGLEDPKHILYFCRELLETNDIKKDQIEICAKELSKRNDYCHFSNKKYPALTPKPDCNSIALAMNKSRLYSDLKDCPAYMGNQAVLNIARILDHFKEPKSSEFERFCYIKPSNSFLDFNLNSDNEKAWQIYLCFNDPIEKDETCLASLLGNHPNSRYSLEKVLVRILAKTRGASLDTTCEMTPTAVFNADRLKYKSGCHILYDIKLCNAVDCTMEFIYNGVTIKNIVMKNKVEIDYLENTQQKANFAQINLLEKELSRKNREVRNLSVLKLMLKQNNKAIVHGVGCAEDILPHFFQKNSLNQCRPLPFIIDGTIENDDKVSLIVRTAIDDIQAPRIIDWNYVFNAIKQYSEYHPRKIWSLHAIF